MVLRGRTGNRTSRNQYVKWGTGTPTELNLVATTASRGALRLAQTEKSIPIWLSAMGL